MNKKLCVGSFCIIFLPPCASLANYFEQPFMQFLPSNNLINCLYSSIFLVAVSSAAFILRRGLMDGLEERLISCWTRCCYFAGRFIVVKAELNLSRKEVLGWVLDLNLCDGEEKGNVFGEALDLVARRYLQCFCVVR